MILGTAIGGPSSGLAQSPAIYAPGLNLPDMKTRPEEPKTEPPAPQTDAKPSAKREISGQARVVSGDTLRVGQVTVRLWGVAAPAMNEFGGYTSMQGLAGLVLGRVVICEPTGGYFRAQRVARCRTGERDLAEEVVSRGYARDCPRQSNGTYAKAERRAVVDVAGGIRLPEECLPSF